MNVHFPNARALRRLALVAAVASLFAFHGRAEAQVMTPWGTTILNPGSGAASQRLYVYGQEAQNVLHSMRNQEGWVLVTGRTDDGQYVKYQVVTGATQIVSNGSTAADLKVTPETPWIFVGNSGMPRQNGPGYIAAGGAAQMLQRTVEPTRSQLTDLMRSIEPTLPPSQPRNLVQPKRLIAPPMYQTPLPQIQVPPRYQQNVPGFSNMQPPMLRNNVPPARPKLPSAGLDPDDEPDEIVIDEEPDDVVPYPSIPPQIMRHAVRSLPLPASPPR